MRCGECAGCRAPDCVKCRYCRDMKKYGGPGLRKQSCKDRKCIAPKIVMLNQSKDNQYVDEKGNIVYSEQSGDTFPGFYEAPDASDRPEEAGAVTVAPDDGNGSPTLSVVRECEIFVKPRLTTTHFIAARFVLVQGQDFHYYLIEPFVVLGRMDYRWRELYKDLGFRNLKGLAGGDVDCHVGNDNMVASMHAVISWDAHGGIDIGTTHGCVGVWHNGKVNIIANDQGFRTTPAYVCFEGEEVIVGDTAVNKLPSHADSTIYHLKRLLGKSHADVASRDFVKSWPFDVMEGAKGGAHAETVRNGEKHEVSPVDFMALLLQNLKELAEDFTGETLEHVVISKPAHADEKHQELLNAAAEKAGVKVLTYLSEPLAAAIAYGLDEAANNPKPEYVLVFDIGGATHDVTLLNADKGLFEVLSSKGKDTLGGEDFTNAVFEHCAKSFLRKTKLDVKTNQKASSRLRLACETAKRTLSTQTQSNIEVDSLMEGEDFSLKLSRPRFEELIIDYVTDIMKEVDAILEENELEKDDIDHVVLVGGSTRIPLVQSMIKKSFEGKTTHLQMPPDEVIAYGATIEASGLAELVDAPEPKKPVNMVNVVPLNLSVALANGSVSELIQRETILPATHTELFTTSEDNQEAVFLQIYEGQRLMAKDNTLVAQLSVAGIPPMSKGDAEIEVTFTVSTKGVLSVTASERKAGKKTLEVTNDPKRLSTADVAAIVKKAEDAADEDDELLGQLEDAEEAEEMEAATEVEAVSSPAVPVVPTQDLD
ncbi:hypothetical protein G195_008842 [Phytophthora kernoviae 00238/432]|uniref:CXXC-type domain-containing protein n=1 Tax=Phytophthora kernoviae 00238/432 TaxID=1284355 RepID=A0A8J4RZ44_9STRA|nr:hypothetical protein G195_008842 [Phytophthora kernoviae 00238/432]